MDTRTGRIYDDGIIQQLIRDRAILDRSRFQPVKLPLTPKQVERRRIGRNDPCPCGSGKKFKHCCLADKHDARFA